MNFLDVFWKQICVWLIQSTAVLFSSRFACETSVPYCLFQWSCWSLNSEKHKSSILCFLSTTLIVHHALFVSVVNDTGRALHFIVAVLHFFPSSPNPAASLLRGLCMNSHCHVQGRVAQGQLIAFMIMISRQIYRACSEHIFQVLPTLLAQMGKMSLQLLAVTSCLSAGHTFWLIRVERRGWITQAFPVKALISMSVTVLVFLVFGHKRAFLDFVFSMTWSLEVMSKEWHRQRFLVFLSFELFMSHKSLILVSVHRWNHYSYSTHGMPELSVDFFLMLATFFSQGSSHRFENDERRWVQPILYILFILWFLCHVPSWTRSSLTIAFSSLTLKRAFYSL